MSVEAKAFLVLLGLLAVLAVAVLVMGLGGDGGGYSEAALERRLAWLKGLGERAGRAPLSLDELAQRPACVEPEGLQGVGIVLVEGQSCHLRFRASERPVRRGTLTLSRGMRSHLALEQERYLPLDLTLSRGGSRPVEVTRSGAELTLTCLVGEPVPGGQRSCRLRLEPDRG